MENFRNYLESSTVHGLVYISTTRRLVRFFWILVVITGFTGAGYLIQTSFQEWNNNPVKTTIETRPISEVNFPLITVCPSRGTYTNLNYDLEKMKNMKSEFDFDYIDDFNSRFTKYFHDINYQKYISELENGLKITDEYRNWYIGAR